MGFDFSIYDLASGNNVAKKPRQSPLEETELPRKNKASSDGSFDFSLYDLAAGNAKKEIEENEEVTAAVDPLYQMYAPEEKTKEELKSMSPEERLQYVKELTRSREYLQSAGFTKGLASGATFGLSEAAQTLKPQPHELMSGLGTLVGSALPITGIAKAVELPLKAYKYGSKGAKILKGLLHGAATGSVYESGVQGSKALRGEEVELSEIPKAAAVFSILSALPPALRKNAEKIPSEALSELFETFNIPEGLPKSQYETAEKILSELTTNPEAEAILEKEGFSLRQRLPTQSVQKPAGNKLAPSRVTPGKDTGLRPVHVKPPETLNEEVGNIFSTKKYYNSTDAGKLIKKEISNIDEEVYRNVNELYNVSRELNANVGDIHPQLVSRLEDSLSELNKIPEPSDVQKRLIKTTKNILKSLAEYEKVAVGEEEISNIIGYKPISNQVLIDQVQSLRHIIDFDFSHGNVKNIFKPLINSLEESILKSAESSGNRDATDAYRTAKSAYRAWSEKFNNSYIRPFRDVSNKDYSKLFKSSMDIDEFNMVKSVLDLSDEGKTLNAASLRELVEGKLSKFFENPKEFTSESFKKTLRELEAVISPEQAKDIENLFRQSSKKSKFKAKILEKTLERKPSPTEERIARYIKKEPEDIQGMMDKRSGIRLLRKDLNQLKHGPAEFKKISYQKMRSLLREGNVDKNITGEELYKVLNKEKNYEIFSELLGEEEVEGARLAAKEIGDDQIAKNLRKENIKQGLRQATSFSILKLIISLI